MTSPDIESYSTESLLKQNAHPRLTIADYKAIQNPADDFDAALTEEYRKQEEPTKESPVLLEWIPKSPVRRLGLALAGATVAIGISRAISGMPDVSSATAAPSTPNTIMFKNDQVMPQPAPMGDYGKVYTRVQIEAPAGLDVRKGTVTQISKLDIYDPNLSSTGGRGHTDTARITEPDEPWSTFTIIEVPDELDKSDNPNNRITFEPKKAFQVTIFERGTSGELDRGRVLAEGINVIPEDLPLVPTQAEKVVSSPSTNR